MKIVINDCFGGFGLSHKAVMLYAELKGITLYPFVNKDKKLDGKFKPYEDGDKILFSTPYYSTRPLSENGEYEENSWFRPDDIDRTNEHLIQVVEKLGKEANGECASLKIIEIPDDIDYVIDEYDGNETVQESHRSWS